MSLSMVAGAADLPLTLEEAKDHLRIADSQIHDEAFIMGLIQAATSWAEEFTRRKFISQIWQLILDEFPAGAGAVHLPFSPLISVDSVAYTDTAGNPATVSSFQTDIAREPGRLAPAVNTSWPSTQATLINAVTIQFTVGYGDRALVPEDIKTAIMHLAGHWYEHRESVIMGTITSTVPQTAEWLLWPKRVLT